MKLKIRSEVLDKIRDEKELTSDEALARYLGLSLGTIQGVRAGRTPSLPTLVLIMEAAHIKSLETALVKEKPGVHSAA